MRRVRAVLVLAVALATPHMAALAHHSFAAEYDGEKPVTVSGTVSKIEWMNPHIYVTLDVKGDERAGGAVADRGLSAEHARAAGLEARTSR